MQTGITMDAEGQVERLVVKQQSVKQLKPMLLCLLMAAASLALLFFGDGLLYKLVGGLGALSFGAAFALLLHRSLKPPVDLLIVDWLGFTDQTPAVGVGFVSWEHVEDIALTQQGDQRFITVRLKDPDALALSPAQKKQLAANARLGSPHISLSLQSAAERYEEVFQIMFAHLFLYRSGQVFEPHY